MHFPDPTEKQAKLLRLAATALAVAILIAAAGTALWALGWVLNRLAAVLLPLAVAGILAYLLDPIVCWFERRKLSRPRAITWVLILLSALFLLLLGTVVPRLVTETGLLIDRTPGYVEQSRTGFDEWYQRSAWGARAQDLWQSDTGARLREWFQNVAPQIGEWAWEKLGSVFSGVSWVLGFALVPFYLFYFLLKKDAIVKSWTDYLPIRESKLKEEVVFVITAINDSLIVFFRGQMLVALGVGVMVAIGYGIIGLNYALVLGLVAGVLGIVPYLGGAVSLVLALGLAGFQFQDWLHPVLVLVVFGVVQFIEGTFLSPRIIGDRVGMHPVMVIVAVLVGTSLLGGIVGGILAIPLAAALRAVLNRYVWNSSREAMNGSGLTAAKPAGRDQSEQQ